MLVVVPMSGTGERFRRAGYTTPKTLLQAEGMPVIEHVVRMFPGPGFRFLFVVNETHARETELLEVLARIAPEAHVEVIPGHKLGPVHAVLAAAEHIPDDEQVVVNYCDFSVAWDARDFSEAGSWRSTVSRDSHCDQVATDPARPSHACPLPPPPRSDAI